MSLTTLTAYVDALTDQHPDRVWLRDRRDDDYDDWTWARARDEAYAAAAWLERRFGADGNNVVILSRNRAHWMLADVAIIASGNVTIPMFTTLAAPTAQYILEFTDAKAMIVGETENWDSIRDVLPEGIELIALPGVELDVPHLKWDDIVAECSGMRPDYECRHDDLISIVFTSGTTGVPKGVMQTHDSMLIPMQRCRAHFQIRPNPRFLSYLPLSHIAERQLVFVQSMVNDGTITFNESLLTLGRDMADTQPNYFFGPPRVWEQIAQNVIAKFGSREAMDAALEADPDGVGATVKQNLGLDEADYLLTAAAPTPPALIEWYERLGIQLMEGFGQTEIMAIALNKPGSRKIGSIGRVPPEVEMKITDEGELVFRADGTAIGYFKDAEKTAETFVDGWVHTGDKGYVDDDGFVFLTGRVKDYFKTIQGKFVAPTPIENRFAEHPMTEQLCLLGRGYSKTVMVAVLADAACKCDRAEVESALVELAQAVNSDVDKHARIGAVIVADEPWTIENECLTPTLKLRREEVEKRYGERARELAHEAAVGRKVLVEWATA